MTSEAAKSAVRANGGLAETPKVVYEELRPVEVIEPAPLRPYAGFVRRYWHYLNAETLTPLSLPSLDVIAEWGSSAVRESAEVHDWAAKVWISDHEAFDPETNTLTLYGHYRAYLFPIWVQTE